jgi:glycosyltransferase involved in cell wall biosynthesis
MGLSTRSSVRSTGQVLLVAPVPPPYGGMALQAGLLQKMLCENGTAVELLGYNQAFSRLKWLERVPGLRTVLRTGLFCGRFWKSARNADVVHILAASWLYYFLVVSPAVVLARLRGKRVVLNYRAGSADEFLRCWGWLAKPFFQMAHVITAPSGFLADVIEQRIGMPVAIVPNIVNLSIFRYRQRRPFQPKMLVTRHMEEIYDVESVVRAFRQIQSKYPAASLWIAGTGSQEPRLRDLVAEWKLRDVRFLGYVDHKTLPSIYDQCDILVNASRVDNFPGSLIEGSASGLVVVSTKAGGIPYVYEHGKNALLVDIGDWAALGLAVERVLQDQALSRKLASAGAELCRRCEWRSIRRGLYAAYGFSLRGGQNAESTGNDQASTMPTFVRKGTR